MYSVKLKLELNILSKLVDLVHTDSSHRSVALQSTSANDSRGNEQDASSNPSSTEKRSSNNDNVGCEATDREPSRLHDTTALPSGVTSRDMDQVHLVPTQQSIAAARTQGRDFDLMYAEMLRSLSR